MTTHNETLLVNGEVLDQVMLAVFDVAADGRALQSTATQRALRGVCEDASEVRQLMLYLHVNGVHMRDVRVGIKGVDRRLALQLCKERNRQALKAKQLANSHRYNPFEAPSLVTV